MQEQTPELPREGLSHRAQYFLGLGLGFLPLIALFGVALPNFSASLYFIYGGLVLYAAVIIGAIVCLVIQRVRFVGYGLLTMVFVGPVVFFIGCLVILSRPTTAP